MSEFDELNLEELGFTPEEAAGLRPREPVAMPELLFTGDRGRLMLDLGAEVTELPMEEEDKVIPDICRRMSGKQRMCVRLLSQGIKQKVIAEMVGYTKETVSAILRSGPGRAYLHYLSGRLDEVHDQVGLIIQQNSLPAVMRLVSIVRDPRSDPKLAATCSFDLLDRAGHKPVQHTKVQLTAGSITKEDLEALSRADEMHEDIWATPALPAAPTDAGTSDEQE